MDTEHVSWFEAQVLGNDIESLQALFNCYVYEYIKISMNVVNKGKPKAFKYFFN